MLDVSAVSAVIGAGLPATFTFLYQRLERLLDRGATPDPDPSLSPTLAGTLALPLQADHQQLAAHQDELLHLRDALSLYQRGVAPLDTTDEPLLRTLGRLRGTLEDIYGQHLTFTGEERPRSGPYVRQELGTVRGDVTGMHADDEITGDAQVSQKADTVESEGRVVGMRATRIGGRPRHQP